MHLTRVIAMDHLNLCCTQRVIGLALSNDIKREVSSIITTKWEIRKGQVVPTSESVKLAGGAVEIEATFLYADLAKSSRLVKVLDRRVAAKILKSFLATTTKLIRNKGGAVLSFDGDRVLGVFVGESKNTSAATCALNISWAVGQVIRPKFESKYETVRNLSFKIAHGVGIDTGTVLMVRAGARGNNDLISIARPPSLAAKLSEHRTAPYRTYVTASVYNRLNNSAKYGGQDKDQNMWQKRAWSYLDRLIVIYRSSWYSAP